MSARHSVEEPHAAGVRPPTGATGESQISAGEPSYLDFLDNLRSLAEVPQRARFVLAPISEGVDVDTILAGIHLAARRRNLTLLVGSVDHGSPSVVPQGHEDSATFADRAVGVQHSLRAASSEDLEARLREVSGEYHLTLLLAPPLGTSLEGVFLGKKTDGVVLFVEPLRTARRELQSVVTRLRRAGCRVAGLVVQGEPNWVPSWIRRFIP